ncbi:MAG: hydrogenase 4 subunit B [Gammaproteobacteria bacterium]|nr:hydrogenase 4 subunit B [Gammaproteobacteria bacterium]
MITQVGHDPLDIALAVCAMWLVLAAASLALSHRPRALRALFVGGAAGSFLFAAAGLLALFAPATHTTLPLGLPQLAFHLRLDALAAVFAILFGFTALAISLYTAGYLRHEQTARIARMAGQYHLLLAAIGLVLLADDAYVFLIAWETMAWSSYLLIISDDHMVLARRAGLLYLITEHMGAIALMLAFGILQAGTHAGLAGYAFGVMRETTLPPALASVVFALGLFGFGAKAGFLPLHAWLPEAHPVAPSPVSALLSGVLLKLGIYGILLFTLELLHAPLWWWGVLMLVLGLVTALFGAIYSAAQNDMKRLLSYSSIENIGLILAGIGLTVLFQAYHMAALATLALMATLYQTLNHAVFKSLLFLGTGSVLHATGERNLGKLGGLIHRMPWVAALLLIGSFAAAGVPPFNGFVSEWLLLQSFLGATSFPQPYLNMAVPLGAAAVVLVAGLAAYVMVKFYGITFLGQPREAALKNAHDAGFGERIALLLLAGGCLFLGLFPAWTVDLFRPAAAQLIDPGAARDTLEGHVLFCRLHAATHADYGPLIVLGALALVSAALVLILRRLAPAPLRRVAPWNGGHDTRTARMQDTAEGFGQPIRQVFAPFFRMQIQRPAPAETAPVYASRVEDPLWYALYLPITRSVCRMSEWVALLRRRRIAIYLLYAFVTLIILLVLAP